MTRPDKFPDFLAQWREVNGENFTPTSYLYQLDATPFVIAAQWLYVPDFVEYRGGIFRAELPLGLSDNKRENLDEWFTVFDGDIPKVEHVGNLLPLWGSLLTRDTNQFDEDLSQLAKTLARAWDALLRVEFPERSFQVEVYDDTDEGPQVTFCSRP
jgi:hypothetical protein